MWLAVLMGAAPAPAAAPERPVRLTVAASGDLLIHTPIAQRALALGGGRRYNFAPLFAPVRRRIAGRTSRSATSRRRSCRGRSGATRASGRRPTSPAPSGGWAGTPAAPRPNHSLDAGQYGVGTTLRALRRARVRATGTARSARERRRTTMLRVRGVRVALLSYTAISNGQAVPHPWTVNWATRRLILADARRARRRGARIVIVNLHWGSEFVHAVTPSQRALAQRLTRSPAIDAIVGQHAHVVQPIRRVNGQAGRIRRGQPDLEPDGGLLLGRVPGRPDRADRLRGPPRAGAYGPRGSATSRPGSATPTTPCSRPHPVRRRGGAR